MEGYMKRFIYCLLVSFTFLMSQEPCEGTCLSEEETINITNSIKELEFENSKNTEIISNLNGQIKLYMEQHANDSLLILLNEQKSSLLNERIKLYDELIKEVKPKWYENKWLWFTLGVITTTGTLKIASDIVD
tara:strand:+ start:24 stop:422 length:399 start_codon:yes stop_codon:yes gene_type:complete